MELQPFAIFWSAARTGLFLRRKWIELLREAFPDRVISSSCPRSTDSRSVEVGNLNGPVAVDQLRSLEADLRGGARHACFKASNI